MTEFLFVMFKSLFTGVGFNAISSVQTSFEAYSATAYTVAVLINNYTVKPIAALLLGALLLLELAKISSRVEGDSKLGVQLIAVMAFKAGFIILMIQNTTVLVSGLNELGMGLIRGASAAGAGGAGQVTEEKLRSALDELGMIEQVGLLPVALICWLLSLVAAIVVPIVVMYRFIEMYVLTAAASLPLVFLAHQETKSMGVGFLRKLAAAVLHGFTLVVVVRVYAAFQSDTIANAPSIAQMWENFTITGLISNMATLLLGQILLVTVVLGAGRFAKALVGE